MFFWKIGILVTRRSFSKLTPFYAHSTTKFFLFAAKKSRIVLSFFEKFAQITHLANLFWEKSRCKWILFVSFWRMHAKCNAASTLLEIPQNSCALPQLRADKTIFETWKTQTFSLLVFRKCEILHQKIVYVLTLFKENRKQRSSINLNRTTRKAIARWCWYFKPNGCSSDWSNIQRLIFTKFLTS